MIDTHRRPSGGRWLILALLLTLASPAALAETYFVRTDGGTADQCTGLSNDSYPGNGAGQDCAWSHPFVALPPGGAPRIAGGDTLLIDSGSYRMGHGAPATKSCSLSWSWDCFMPSIPSGPAPDRPTRILGQGHDQGCSAAPELWGTERAGTVLNLEGSSNIELACLEVTDRASCIEFHCHNGQCDGEVAACDRSSPPWGDWASTGVSANDSSNVAMRDINIHGLASRGVYAGRLTDWSMERVNINANGWAGWDGDIGADSSNAGTLLFVDSEIAWNGCVEDWQSGDKFGCWAQGGGGYGDGIGLGESGGDWIFENVQVHHNTSDGIDLLYLRDNGQATVRRSLIDSNAGNQVKVSRSAVIENSVVIGNCSYFSDHPNMHDGDVCRALGDTVYVGFNNASRTDLINNTIIGEGNCVISGGGGSADSVLSVANNLIIGNPYWHSQSQDSCLYYSGSSEQVVWKNNSIHDVRHGACPGDSQCSEQPGIKNDSLAGFDPQPTQESSLIAAADASMAPENDFNNLPRGVNGGPDIGAIEYGAEHAPEPPDRPVAAFSANCKELDCAFVAKDQSDADYQWLFGDGSTGRGASVSHRFSSPGSYDVTLTVTDAHHQSDSATQAVTVSASSGDGISLVARAVERRETRFTRLRWQGIDSRATDIYRNGVLIAATFSYQLYADRLDENTSGQVEYRVCRHDSQSCSQTVIANF